MGEILCQRHQGVTGVNRGAAAVHFVHAATADGAAERTGFLFQLVFNRQHAFLDHQLVVRGVEVAVQIEELERRWATRGGFIMENRAVRLAGLVTDDQLIGADGERQLTHQFIEAARRFDGGGNASDIAVQPVQHGRVFGAQGAGVGQ